MYKGKFKILKQIWERNDIEKQDSDSAYFLSLLYTGELITKLICAGLLSGVSDDAKKHKYTQLYNLVRADGIGDWAKAIEELVSGPTSHLLSIQLRQEQKLITQKVKSGHWQFDVVNDLFKCLKIIGENVENNATKTSFKNWFILFTRLRNKTRGHGAISSDLTGQLCSLLEKSLLLISNNFTLFNYEWAYLSQNLSGKFKVLSISENCNSFNYLKSNAGKDKNYERGIYLYLNRPVYVDLVKSDGSVSDFFFPNGNFSSKRFEVLSYVSGSRDSKDNSRYLLPPGDLPTSETEGLAKLEVIGDCFTNLPKVDSIYINREDLETELNKIVINERHPMITLLGRGGIGKTTLALRVLRELCLTNRFQTILWFSSRDIDLLDYGAKSVQPQVLGIEDVAKEFVNLVNPELLKQKKFESKEFIEEHLKTQIDGVGPMLLVFDNFETVQNPSEMFNWLDTYIRTPNKILITSRISEFKADYPITVSGMNINEFKKLVNTVSDKLGINDLIDTNYINKLYEESAGHPYVAKILLGVVANENKAGDISRIVAGQDEMLTALFERTYTMLSQAAKKVFLTLASWRSTVPKIGIEAIITSTSYMKMNVEDAITELNRFSFIDIYSSKKDNSKFISLPLSAYLFGQSKLVVSTLKQQVYNDREMLMMLGVGKVIDVDEGVDLRFEKFFQQVAYKISTKKNEKLASYTPILDYICHKQYKSWITYGALLEELRNYKGAISKYERFIQNESDPNKNISVWKKLADLYKKEKNYFGEIHSLIEMCEIDTTSEASISSCSNRLNRLLSEKKLEGSEDDKNAIISRMIELLKNKLENGSLNDLNDRTNFAWLYIHLGKIAEARKLTTQILKIEPDHFYALKLQQKFKRK
ncbi:tetratricopeptide repeat protein [uncultured Winogradskyella sp.]|uniref:tetratricopeptide repeat protein n=1 Tax=uncultured Winogradskyella sp. TaxID=395353 RepID=UPI002636F463|nr:tetratricopeptide repeat protein [uncultured Winogradskyella sp.]